MTQQGPWSVKGIDPKARSIARDRAQRQGVTLGQYLNSLLLDDDAGLIEDVQIAETAQRGANAGDLRRMSSEIDLLSRKLEEAQARSARAVSGLDKSILSLMGKMEASGKAQLGGLERVTRAMAEIESTQAALRTRIDTLEADQGAGPTLNALKTLQSSLEHLGQTLQERMAAVEEDQTQFRSLFDEKVDSFTRSIDQAVTNAIRNTSGSLSNRVEQIEQQMSSADRRMEGALGRITDAASRFEAFETKAERAITDTSWKMERALETNLNRSRQMSKEVLERVESIEEKTREAVSNLSDAVSRITDRLSRAERKTDTALHVLERSVSEIDEKLERGGRGPSTQDFDQIQSLFQKRLDSLAEDLSRPIHALRADVEKRLEDAMRSGGASPERMERLERALRQVQDHIQVSEARQADAVEAMSAQVERLSRAIDDRLSAVEAKGDARSIEDVRREMLKLADTIDARIGGAMDAVRSDIGRLNTSVDDRIHALEKSSAAALDAVGEQVAVVAERLQKRHDESIKHLNSRIDETRVESRRLDSSDIDSLADRLDERVKESERRSAEAIGQIGEQVARVADRLQSQQIESVRMFETRLADSGRSHEARLNDLMDEMQRRMDEIGEQSHAKLGPVHNTISSIARRLESVEDQAPKHSKAPIVPPPAPPTAAEDFVILEDVGPAAELIEEGSSGIVGVDPPPFDKTQDAELFVETSVAPEAPGAEPVRNVEDLLETDDVVLAPKADAAAREPLLDGGPSSFLAQARRAARENRTSAAVSGRRGIGKGPLIASAALAVAVAGGGALTVMRGKQEARADDFAKLDPAAPAVAAPAAGAEADLFGDGAAPAAPAPAAAREPAAGDLFDAPVTGDAKAATPNQSTPSVITLQQAVRNGDPVALYDYAVELLGTGEKQRAVQILKEAAGRGLVMAEYRLAKLYEKGEGVPRDIAAARSWTEKAAIGGNVKAMHDLAVFYAEGDAGPQSYAAAVEWFRQASDLGLVDSQYNLAVLYEQGLGLTQDRSEAAFWFEVAGRAGDQDAARRARAMLSDMPATQAEQIKRRARTFAPKTPIARANGELGARPWDAASPAQVAEVQRLLDQLGYSPGPADGKTSAATQNAIRAFESDNELPMTGQPSVTLLRHLRTSLNTAN
jgi:localization factor PodJL